MHYCFTEHGITPGEFAKLSMAEKNIMYASLLIISEERKKQNQKHGGTVTKSII